MVGRHFKIDISEKTIVFLHIPKNGGTTLIPILAQNFKPETIFKLEVKDYVHVNYEELKNMPDEQLQKIRLFTGHMHFGLHKELRKDVSYITFLRHPVERLLSYYYFVKRTPQHENHDLIFKNGWNFHDFVLNSTSLGVSNIQVELISGTKDSSEKMLKNAIENIQTHFSFIGFQEAYDESLILIQHVYGLKIPHYKRRNSTSNKPLTHSLDQETLALIQKLNKEDILLYEYCKSEFEKQFKNIPFFKYKLYRLRMTNKIFNSTKIKILNKKFEHFRFK